MDRWHGDLQLFQLSSSFCNSTFSVWPPAECHLTTITLGLSPTDGTSSPSDYDAVDGKPRTGGENPRREDGAFGKRKSAAGERRRPGREGAAGGAEVFWKAIELHPYVFLPPAEGLWSAAEDRMERYKEGLAT